MRQKRRDRHALLPFDNFGTHGENALEQEVTELSEGGGFLAGDAPLRQQAKNLGESAVDTGGVGEVAAGGIEFGEIEFAAEEGADAPRGAEQLLFPFVVIAAEGRMNFAAAHGALAAVREHKLAALGRGGGVYPAGGGRIVESVGMGLRSAVFWRNVVGVRGERSLFALGNLIIVRKLVIVGLVRREIGEICLRWIFDGRRRRKRVMAVL